MKLLNPFGIELDADPMELSPDVIRALLEKHRLLLFRNNAFSKDALVEFGLALGDLLEWDFGRVMELKASKKPENYLFSHEAVPFHWDGAFHRVPSFLVFNCIEAPEVNAGGETLFTNTETLYASLSEFEKQHYQSIELCYETAPKAHYGGRFETKLIQADGSLRYAEPVETQFNPVSLTVSGTDSPQAFIEAMRTKLYDERHCLEHRWQRGDLLIACNTRLLHGRRAFKRATNRHIRRIQVL